ncbi:hypothetical protein LBMAG56_04370 [Verrucomicrobiota bacterium]|nr:hypothetical protein LBMAG56_04370 [Verrucomicrobiota bacterium]
MKKPSVSKRPAKTKRGKSAPKKSKPAVRAKAVVARPRPAAATTRSVLGTARKGPDTAVPINPKWAWHQRVLLELRERLLKARGEQLSAAAEPLEGHSMNEADSASDEFDHNLALSELSAEQDALFEIEEALKRIANGSYGTCEETARRIPAERLKAVPWTRFVTEVAARLERRNLVKRPHLAAPGSIRGLETEDLEESTGEEEQPAR